MNLINPNFDSLDLNEYGTENMAPFLYSLIRFLKPHKILEVGIGHSTIFLAHALKDIFSQKQTQNINHPWVSNGEYFKNQYNPTLDVVDNFTQKNYSAEYYINLLKKNKIDTNVNLINKELWEHYNSSSKDYDFIWFDAGTKKDHYDVMNIIYPTLPPGGVIIFHNTIANPPFEPSLKQHKINQKLHKLEIITLKEPYKNYQDSFTILKKQYE